jgi:hypothetical protein
MFSNVSPILIALNSSMNILIYAFKLKFTNISNILIALNPSMNILICTFKIC